MYWQGLTAETLVEMRARAGSKCWGQPWAHWQLWRHWLPVCSVASHSPQVSTRCSGGQWCLLSCRNAVVQLEGLATCDTVIPANDRRQVRTRHRQLKAPWLLVCTLTLVMHTGMEAYHGCQGDEIRVQSWKGYPQTYEWLWCSYMGVGILGRCIVLVWCRGPHWLWVWLLAPVEAERYPSSCCLTCAQP